jgi:hypothetical protein
MEVGPLVCNRVSTHFKWAFFPCTQRPRGTAGGQTGGEIGAACSWHHGRLPDI